MPMHRTSLRQWAVAEGIPVATATRRFHAGKLTDRSGRPVHAHQDRADSTIWVYPQGPPDPLAAVDIPALVRKLEDAGYVLLRPEEAAQLGIRLPNLEVVNGDENTEPSAAEDAEVIDVAS